MSFNVKHGVGAGPAAVAAFSGGLASAQRRGGGSHSILEAGRGRLGERARPVAAPVDPRLTLQERQFAENERARQFQLEFAGLRHEQGLDSQDYNYGLQQDAAKEAQKRSREDLEYSLTTRQRIELEHLADAEAKAMASSDYTADEKEELRRRFDAKRAGIAPVARPKPKTSAELFAERTFTDPKTGRVYALDADGVPGHAIYEPPERTPTMQDRIKAFEVASKLYANPETGVLDEASMAKAKATAAEMLGEEPQGGAPAEWSKAYVTGQTYDPAAEAAAATEAAAPSPTAEETTAQAKPEEKGILASAWDYLFGGDKAEAKPMTVEDQLAQVSGSTPIETDEALEPDKIPDLVTLQDQIDQANRAMEKLAASEEARKAAWRRQTDSLMGEEGVAARDKRMAARTPEQIARDEEVAKQLTPKQREVADRIAMLEARRVQLHQQMESLEAAKIARDARARLGR